MDEPKPNPFVNPADPDNLSEIHSPPHTFYRQTAHQRMLDEVAFLRNRADRLEKLAAAIVPLPSGTPEESLLWELICDALKR